MKDPNEILQKLETIISELNHTLRYEKGDFRAGSCIIKGSKVVIVNKHFTEEGKIRSLLDIVRVLRENQEEEMLCEESLSFVEDLMKSEE
jgi:flagellin-specific chaperone FliS